VNNYFIGYCERVRDYEFYHPKLKTIFETESVTFFENMQFGGKNKARDFVLEEKLVIPHLIHIDAFHKASSEPLKDIVTESPIEDNLVVYEEQTQDPQEPMLHEVIPLRRSMREKKSVIPYDYVVFLHENEENNVMMKDDLVTFYQAMHDSN